MTSYPIKEQKLNSHDATVCLPDIIQYYVIIGPF